MLQIDMNYQQKFSEKIKKKYLQKVEVLKGLFKTIFPGIDDDNLVILLGRCSHYHCNDRNHLGEDEAILYDFLLKNNLNPCTVYKWFLVHNMPENIQELLQKGKLTQRQALKLSTNERRQKENTLGLELREECRKIVREVFENAKATKRV
mgnify:FL=1